MTSNANGLMNNEVAGQSSRLVDAGSLQNMADSDLRTLRLFNHYRHDWMNDIQMVFGYVKLKKYDKLMEWMEKINEKVRQEGYISKLGIPSLIIALLMFQAEVKELSLELHLDEEIRMQELAHPQAAAEFILHMLDCFKVEAVNSSEENVLKLNWNLVENGLELAASYEGGYDQDRIIAAEANIRSEWILKLGWHFETQYHDRGASWYIRLPKVSEI